MPSETSWSPTTTKKTPVEVGYGDFTSSRLLEVIQGNTKVSINSVTSDYGDITIGYALKNEESDVSSIDIKYSTDGGSTWNDMTDAGGSSEGLLSLATSESGTSHTFIWDSATDLGVDFKGDVYIRVTAYDRDNHKGSQMNSTNYKHSVDNRPETPTIISPEDNYFRKDETPTFQFAIPNPKAGNSKLHFRVQLDTEDTFDTSELVTFRSNIDQVGWEYDTDGNGNFAQIPYGGIDIPSDPTLIGNTVKFTIQTDERLSQNKYYWRVAAGGVL